MQQSRLVLDAVQTPRRAMRKAAEYSQRLDADLERFSSLTCRPPIFAKLPKTIRMWMRCGLVLLAVQAAVSADAAPWQTPEEAAWTSGEVAFPASQHPGEGDVPEPFRLQPHRFGYRQKPLGPVSQRLAISIVEFPSPVTTPYPKNNTVHCEYYQPLGGHCGRGVVVLHILGGDFNLSRIFCNQLAQHGVSALFLKMPHYGPRRPANEQQLRRDMQPQDAVGRMRQAVLDIRRATAWLGDRPEVNADELGVFGISLGGITSALAAEAEPRLKHVCLTLAGGDLTTIAWESPEAQRVQQAWSQRGVTREELAQALRPVDPLTWADRLHDRRILMLNAKDDQIIPRSCTNKLWLALGQPPIRWYEGGHYSFGNIFSVLHEVKEFYAVPQ